MAPVGNAWFYWWKKVLSAYCHFKLLKNLLNSHRLWTNKLVFWGFIKDLVWLESKTSSLLGIRPGVLLEWTRIIVILREHVKKNTQLASVSARHWPPPPHSGAFYVSMLGVRPYNPCKPSFILKGVIFCTFKYEQQLYFSGKWIFT